MTLMEWDQTIGRNQQFIEAGVYRLAAVFEVHATRQGDERLRSRFRHKADAPRELYAANVGRRKIDQEKVGIPRCPPIHGDRATGRRQWDVPQPADQGRCCILAVFND